MCLHVSLVNHPSFYIPQGHFYDCFPTGSMYIIYNYIIWCHICVVYVVKEVASFRGLSQLMGMAHNRICTRALQTTKEEAAVVYMRNWN